ncbi:MAG: hypothetical protein WAZ12_05385 [Candidatus Absconditicoccaceae bacterium]
MIYTVSKKIILLSALFLSVGLGLADIISVGQWSAEGRDSFMIRQEGQDFSCNMRDGSCCKGNVCSQTMVSCIQGYTPVVKGCSERCTVIVECKKREGSQKDDEKKVNESSGEKVKNTGSKIEKVDKDLLKRFNIETENETEDDVKIKVKTVKIEKINDMGSRLEDIIEKTESLNYNTSRLRSYVANFKNIKYYLNQNNLTTIQTKQYNKALNNTMNNIKQELSNIKTIYKSD